MAVDYYNRSIFGLDFSSTTWPGANRWYPAYVDSGGILHTTISGTVNATCSTVHVDAVSGTCPMLDESSNSPTQWVDTADNCITYKTYLYAYNVDYGLWDRLITTEGTDNQTRNVLYVGLSGNNIGVQDKLRTTSMGDNQSVGILNVGISGFSGTVQDRLRTALAWNGGTQSTPVGYLDVALLGRYDTDTSGTLQAIRSDSFGNMAVTLENADAQTGYDDRTSIACTANPFGAANYVLDTTSTDISLYGEWDRARSTESIVSGTITEGLPAIGLVERNHYCTNFFSSTVFTSTGVLTASSAADISKFYTKTICHYVDGSASTLEIWARCCDGGTYRKYYEDTNVASDDYVTKSFTEALHDVYVQVETSTLSSTVWTQVAMQS